MKSERYYGTRLSQRFFNLISILVFTLNDVEIH
jgi:hypothetical protein